jgi:hypothetical protein
MKSRRNFLRTLGLGAGSVLLAPLARRIVHADARGPVRVVLVMSPAGSWGGLTPPGVAYDVRANASGALDALPSILEPLARWRDRTILVDGLHHRFVGGSDHGAGYSTFSGLRREGKVEILPPAGVTLDQHLGATIGAAAPRKAIHFATPSSSNVFAEGPDRPVVPFRDPLAMHASLFGGSGRDGGRLRHERLRDALRDDANRLLRSFRGDERRPLEHYLTALEDYDRRREAELAVSCDSPPTPSGMDTEDLLESFFDMGALTLGCGLSQVLAGQIFTGNTHFTRVRYHRIHRGTRFDAEPVLEDYGHAFADDGPRGPAMQIIHRYHATLIARLIERLEAMPEGDGSVFDRTVIVHVVDGGTGAGHHVNGERFPAMIVAGRDVPLRTGRYELFARGSRSLVDLWLTLLEAVGAERGEFARPTATDIRLVQPEAGPIETLLA